MKKYFILAMIEMKLLLMIIFAPLGFALGHRTLILAITKSSIILDYSSKLGSDYSVVVANLLIRPFIIHCQFFLLT